ncbi:MAG: ubiquinol-cytochrome c reductase iron-sulfur subunit [Anaerolineales bacterium]
MNEQDNLDRHDFLAISTWAIGGFIALGLGIPAIAYVVGPAIKQDETQVWIKVGSSTKVELGIPTLFKVKVERKTGWIVDEDEISVYVLTENGRDYLVMSNVCTHLGCRVRYLADRDQFLCPCHNGVFDKEGNVVSGPPPKPLNRFMVKIEDGQIYIFVA